MNLDLVEDDYLSLLTPSNTSAQLKKEDLEGLDGDEEGSASKYGGGAKRTRNWKIMMDSVGKQDQASSTEEENGGVFVPELTQGRLIEHLLETNDKLIRVCLDYQNRGWINDPDFALYQKRLQSNLFFLANIANHYLLRDVSTAVGGDEEASTVVNKRQKSQLEAQVAQGRLNSHLPILLENSSSAYHDLQRQTVFPTNHRRHVAAAEVEEEEEEAGGVDPSLYNPYAKNNDIQVVRIRDHRSEAEVSNASLESFEAVFSVNLAPPFGTGKDVPPIPGIPSLVPTCTSNNPFDYKADDNNNNRNENISPETTEAAAKALLSKFAGII